MEHYCFRWFNPTRPSVLQKREGMIDNPFMLVVSKMTKKDQQSILVHL